jgi:hypothetical protein
MTLFDTILILVILIILGSEFCKGAYNFGKQDTLSKVNRVLKEHGYPTLEEIEKQSTKPKNVKN